jgi:hypothetical protein
MNTATIYRESHILNGSANLNYTYEDFLTLSEGDQRSFIWSAIVQLRLNIDYSMATPDMYKMLFIQIKQAQRQQKRKSVTIAGKEVFSAAQMMTMAAYEERLLPFRSLAFECECENAEDLKQCVSIIDSYNEFSARKIKNSLDEHLNLKSFYGETNPNNGNDMFKYTISRESSPAIYVTYNVYGKDLKAIKYREGATVHADDFSAEEFKTRCALFAKETSADIFKIEEGDYGMMKTYKARFWWD